MTIDLNQLLNSEGFLAALITIAVPILVKILHGYGIAVPMLEKIAALWSVEPCKHDQKKEPEKIPQAIEERLQLLESLIDDLADPQKK